jgi:hypothetical protein
MACRQSYIWRMDGRHADRHEGEWRAGKLRMVPGTQAGLMVDVEWKTGRHDREWQAGRHDVEWKTGRHDGEWQAEMH